MEKYMRSGGIIASAVGCILYFVGFMTNHWAENDASGIHWGLWNYCTNFTSDNKSLHEQDTTTVDNLMFTSTTPQTNISNSTLDVGPYEEECDQFSMSVVPGMFHLVRAFMICGVIALFYCILSGRILKNKIEKEDPWYSAHRGEIALLFGAFSGLIGTCLFKSSYRSYDWDDYGEVKLGSSHGITRSGSILISVGACLMIAPRFKEKFLKCLKGESFSFLVSELRNDPFRACYRCLSCQERPTCQTNEPRGAVEVSEVRRSSIVSFDDISTADYDEPSQDIFMVDIRNSPPYSSRHGASFSDPAPRYEDLSPRDIETVPPPPSYDEAIAGMYATTDISSSSASRPTASVPSSPLLTDRPELLPPEYEESVA